MLNTLLQEYHYLFKQYKKVVVSDQLCHVTKLGTVKVDFGIDGTANPLSYYNQVVHSFATIVSQILETVTTLAMDKSWLDSKECSNFQDRIMKILYQYHSHENKMYQALLHEVNVYMEDNKIRCNLIPAIIRKGKNEPAKEPPFFMR